MFGRNAFALCALVLFGLALSVSAKPQALTENEIETEVFSLLEDLIDYLKDNLRIAKECTDDALKFCKATYPGKAWKLPRCMLKYVLQKQGLCNITNPPKFPSSSMIEETPKLMIKY